MLYRTEGVVLRNFPFGEADLIVTYLTPDLGIIKLFAKSPRKIKSRFGSSLEPLTHAKISFWGKEDTALPRLTQSDILHSFHSVRNTLNRFMKVSEILELIICFVPERDANKKVYNLFLHTLQNIENNSDENMMINHFKIKILKFAGFAPKLDGCGRCGKNGDFFYIAHGSILCEACAKGVDSPIRVSSAVIRIYNDLLNWDVTKIVRIKPSNALISELSDIMNMHIQYVLARPLKCGSFYHYL